MNQHVCPHCGELGISSVRRAFLGPAIPATCRKCSGKISVPLWSGVAMLPWFVALGFVPLVNDNTMFAFFLGAFGATGMWFVWEHFVPLVKA